MSNYFISKIRPVEEGKSNKFQEMDIRFRCRVTKIIAAKFVGFTWEMIRRFPVENRTDIKNGNENFCRFMKELK